MVFSSHIFLFYFLPSVLLLYYTNAVLVPLRWRLYSANVILLGASYLFYGWGHPGFTLLLFLSTAVDYGCAHVIGPQDRKRGLAAKLALLISILTNLGVLGFFKYGHFIFVNLDLSGATQVAGLADSDAMMLFALPLGLSFYTLQSMSYTIDVYHKRMAPAKGLFHLACYIAFFPQLVAGPILRFSELGPQVLKRHHTLKYFYVGVLFFSIGLGKKVLLANPCGLIADGAFKAEDIVWFDAWLGCLAYGMQIYFDFSGYSDMAIGLGRMFGFKLPENFCQPYRANSLQEFWRRWHVTLSNWLRDYLYFPLGGSRAGGFRTGLNLMATMLIGGLWHGAAWTFVIWGGLHGLGLIVSRAFGKLRLLDGWWGVVIGRGCVFLFVTVLWVFFRADSLGCALDFLASMMAMGEEKGNPALISVAIRQPYLLSVLCISVILVFYAPTTKQLIYGSEESGGANCAVPGTGPWSACTLGWALLCLWAAIAALSTQTYNPFIYFIF